MATNYARDALLLMDSRTRRKLLVLMHDKVNADPDEHEPCTRLWYGILSEIVDIEHDEAAVLAQLEKAFRL